MADSVKKVRYFKTAVPSRPGRGAAMLGALADAGVDLLAVSAFPRRGKAQVDLVTPDAARLIRVAREQGWRLAAQKRAFLIQGRDEVGAVSRHLAKLAKAEVNVTAVDAVSAGAGRYGMLLFVKPKDYTRAARALGAR